jgi:hypothetical protein
LKNDDSKNGQFRKRKSVKVRYVATGPAKIDWEISSRFVSFFRNSVKLVDYRGLIFLSGLHKAGNEDGVDTVKKYVRNWLSIILTISEVGDDQKWRWGRR